MLKKVLLSLVIGVGGILIVTGILKLSGFQFSHKAAALENKFLDMFSQNDILFYDPNDCLNSGGIINVDSSFRIDNTVDAMDQWYAEGCIDNGTCVGHKYYGGITDMGGVMRIPMVVAQANLGLLERDTETDYDFGGMQYIYAENYDIQFNGFEGWMTTFTKKPGANSTRKYYWIVLPDKAYMSVAGDTYIATFENLNEPVYFIALDAHACQHQSEGYCEKAEADPDGVKIGKQFLGAFTITGGDFTEVAGITGKLTSFHRINGRGEVLVNEVSGNKIVVGGGGSSNNSNSSTGADAIVKKANELSWPVGDPHVKTYVGNAAYDEAARRRGGHFVTPFSENIVNSDTGMVYSCARFVSMVLLESDVDPDFANGQGVESSGLRMLSGNRPNSLSYYFVNSPKWEEVTGYDGHGYDMLRPGDILINDNNYLDGNGTPYDHTFIYMGNGIQAEGNANNWAPSQFAWEDNYGSNGFRAFRLKDSGSCTSYEDEYPQYWQHDYANSDHENSDHDWTQDTYNGGPFGSNACGPTSMAMLATVATGKDIYPQDIAKFGNYVTTSPTDIDPLAGKEYGFEVIPESYSSKTDAYNKIKDYLNKGYMIHLSGEGCHDGFATVKGDGTCSDGHYIGIFSIDSNDKVWVANPAYMGNSQVDLQSVIDAIHNSVFTAIKGSGNSGKCSNSNYCSTGKEDKNSAAGEAAKIPLEERMDYLFPNGAPTSESAMNTYLETIEIPIKDESGAKTTMKLTVHKKLSSEIKAVFQDILAIDNFRVKAAETAAYNWRKMASGTGNLSHHSYGVAIDLNWNDNPATYTGGTYNPGGNYYSVTDEIVQIWKKHGFYWGGDWDGHYKDYMHFTYTDH